MTEGVCTGMALRYLDSRVHRAWSLLSTKISQVVEQCNARAQVGEDLCDDICDAIAAVKTQELAKVEMTRLCHSKWRFTNKQKLIKCCLRVMQMRVSTPAAIDWAQIYNKGEEPLYQYLPPLTSVDRLIDVCWPLMVAAKLPFEVHGKSTIDHAESNPAVQGIEYSQQHPHLVSAASEAALAIESLMEQAPHNHELNLTNSTILAAVARSSIRPLRNTGKGVCWLIAGAKSAHLVKAHLGLSQPPSSVATTHVYYTSEPQLVHS